VAEHGGTSFAEARTAGSLPGDRDECRECCWVYRGVYTSPYSGTKRFLNSANTGRWPRWPIAANRRAPRDLVVVGSGNAWHVELVKNLSLTNRRKPAATRVAWLTSC
jgi:hypothetical protein